MGLRSAISKKIFKHMSKKDARRQVDEGEKRGGEKNLYAGIMSMPGSGRNEHIDDVLQKDMDKSRKRESGGQHHMRFRDKMQRRAGISDHGAEAMQERFKKDYSVKQLKKQQKKMEKEARRRSSPAVEAAAPTPVPVREPVRKKRREQPRPVVEETRGLDDSSLDFKNHDVALPKWVIDVDQNNRLADFEDLIKGEHRKRKAGRHTSGDADMMATSQPAGADLGAAAAETFAPMTRKKRKAHTLSEEDMALMADPLPVHTAEEKAQRKAEKAAMRQEHRAAQAVAEPEAPMQRRKKRRQADDDV